MSAESTTIVYGVIRFLRRFDISNQEGCCGPDQSHLNDNSWSATWKSFDKLLWGSLFLIGLSYTVHYSGLVLPNSLLDFAAGVVSIGNEMWWGLLIAIIFVGLLDGIPRELVMAVLGQRDGLSGLLRATLAGLLLDLCNHGIVVIGMKLYERGASLGQTVAFLVASPWNSFSMTVILWSLIGWQATVGFIALSVFVGLTSGLIFESFERKQILPPNPNRFDLPQNLSLKKELSKYASRAEFRLSSIFNLLVRGIKSSKMVMRWILFGVVLAAAVRGFVPEGIFETYFGPSLLGLGLTLVFATIIEVCSEGSVPIAADLAKIAGAPGNAFAFLMTGVSTDYTEIIALRETTKSWKIALFLPLITAPQIILLGYVLNQLWGQ